MLLKNGIVLFWYVLSKYWKSGTIQRLKVISGSEVIVQLLFWSLVGFRESSIQYHLFGWSLVFISLIVFCKEK